MFPAKMTSANLGGPSLSPPLDLISGEVERRLGNDIPILENAETDTVAFPPVVDKDVGKNDSVGVDGKVASPEEEGIEITVTDNNFFGDIGPTVELDAEPFLAITGKQAVVDMGIPTHANEVLDKMTDPDLTADWVPPVASESKGEVRGRRAEACEGFENGHQLKTDGPGAGYGHSGFDRNGARQSWADIV
ncbi:hypothetical protein U1Q18_036426, partial [Sarracenia purpurea var. burkii]